MAQIVIIGAGLTGISTAYHLEQIGFTDYLLFEKESEPGGLCRTVMQDGFTFDFTGHLLHIGDEYFRHLIKTLIGFEQFNTINRRSFIYSHDTYTRYPFQINLFGLPTRVIIECITAYVNRPSIEQPRNFREWVQTNFGDGFGNHFFYPYQEKIFAHTIDQLTASWTSTFVPSTSLEQILAGALSDQKESSVGYNAQFFYPKQGGIFSWVKQFAHALTQPVITGTAVKKINMHTKECLFEDGHVEPYETLINTIPLDRFIGLLDEPSDSFLIDAQSHLKYNKVVNFNLGIDHDISSKHWVYYPEKQYPFYRLGFPHNFSDTMAPMGCGSLYGEFSHINQSPDWVERTLHESIAMIQKLFKISHTNIQTEVVMHIDHAYVLFDKWRDTHLPALHEQLHAYNIYSIGRYGGWKYSSMQDSVLEGKQIVHTLTGKTNETITHAPEHLHRTPELPR